MATFNERLNAAQEFAFLQIVDASSTGALNNYDVSNISSVKFTAAVTSITGFAAVTNGKILTVTNGYTAAFTFANESASSTAANRVLTGNANTFTLQASQSVMLQYDNNSSRWRLISAPSVGSNIAGRIDGTTVPTGILGEVIADLTASGTGAAAAGAYKAIRTINLTPGAWSLSATAILFRNGATLDVSGNWLMNINNVSASVTGTVFGYSETVLPQGLLVTGSILTSAHLSQVMVNIASNTTYYMNCSVTYSVAVPQWYGSIVARRIG